MGLLLAAWLSMCCELRDEPPIFSQLMTFPFAGILFLLTIPVAGLPLGEHAQILLPRAGPPGSPPKRPLPDGAGSSSQGKEGPAPASTGVSPELARHLARTLPSGAFGARREMEAQRNVLLRTQAAERRKAAKEASASSDQPIRLSQTFASSIANEFTRPHPPSRPQPAHLRAAGRTVPAWMRAKPSTFAASSSAAGLPAGHGSSSGYRAPPRGVIGVSAQLAQAASVQLSATQWPPGARKRVRSPAAPEAPAKAASGSAHRDRPPGRPQHIPDLNRTPSPASSQ